MNMKNDASSVPLIIVYDDNPDYGGHQVMAAYGTEALAADPACRVVCYLNPRNEKLRDRLNEIRAHSGNLEIKETPFDTKKFQGVRNRFAGASIAALADLFRAEAPALVLCIQGEIEDSSQAVLAANRAGVPCVSYIPVPHTMALMGAKLGALRDVLNQYLFNRPDGYITISKSMKDLLRQRGVTKPIDIVHNGIDPERFQIGDRNAIRDELGLPRDVPVVGMIGRVEFKQKQQDFLLRTVAGHATAFGDVHVVIVGSGPDSDNLSAVVTELGLENRVTLIPWMKDASRIYPAMDFLVLPSRFEGVPLVMLEALFCGVPVLGSNRDGMRDLLPESWRFETENADDFAKIFINAREHWQEEIGALREKICGEMTVSAFQTNYHTAVMKWVMEEADGGSAES